MNTNLYSMTHDTCLEMIYEYQLTNNRKLLYYLLAKFDKLLVKIIRDLRRANSLLNEESIQEMYHVAIVGMEKAFLRIKPGFDSNLLPAKIQSYVWAEVKQTYRHKTREYPSDHVEVHNALKKKTYDPHRENHAALDLKFLFEASKLPQDWVEVIKLKFIDEMTTKEIQEKLSLSVKQVERKLYIGLAQLRLLVKHP